MELNRTRADFESEATRIESLPTLLKEEKTLMGWLAVIEGSCRGEGFRLYQGRNIVGSSSQCDIVVPDEGVQDRHLSIRCSKGKWVLTDLDSDGGTQLNGKRVYRTELSDGDKVKAGKVLFQIKML